MFLAFLGDVHGCALHALAAVMALQHHERRQIDAVIQVGDFGAFPSLDRLQPVDREYLVTSPAQGDVLRLLHADSGLLASLRHVRDRLARPVLVVSGNHEDHEWLVERHRAAEGAVAVAIDDTGIFEHVVDGAVVDVGDVRLAVLGRIDAPGFPYDFDRQALDRLHALERSSIDVLVTHDGPYGMSTSWNGRVQGSRAITELIEHLQPRLHISGHYHHMNGPRRYGATISFALANLVEPRHRRHRAGPSNPRQCVSSGSIGVVDTETWMFRYVTDAWLEDICGDEVDLDQALERL